MTLASVRPGECWAFGVLVIGPFEERRFPMISGRKPGFEYAMLSPLRGILRFWSSILMSWCTPSVVSAPSMGRRLSVSCDFDFLNIEGRMDNGGWTIRDALPKMLSSRSGRRLKSSCLNRFTARTCRTLINESCVMQHI
jgi:hypothetical protein